MLIENYIPRIVNNYYFEYYTIYKNKLLSLIAIQFQNEDIYGTGDKYRLINQYLYAFHYVSLIYAETKVINELWNYFENKYDILNIKKKLQCVGIDLNLIFKIFDLPIVTGVTPVEVEASNKIESLHINSSLNYDTINILLPIIVKECKINLLADNGNTLGNYSSITGISNGNDGTNVSFVYNNIGLANNVSEGIITNLTSIGLLSEINLNL